MNNANNNLFASVESTFNKWLLIADQGYIRLILAVVIANILKGDPFWLFIVAPPGGTKTEPLRALGKIPGIYPISDLTEQTFISGDRQNKKASLLLRLPSQSILVLKDFTTVLSMHPDKRGSILSQLREIYDGHYSKDFGTGERKEWKGKLGFIAGVTAAVDRHYSVYQVLGERFLQYRPLQPNRILVAKRAMENNGREAEMRQELQEAALQYVTNLTIPNTPPDVPERFTDRIAALAHLAATGRSGVFREGHSTREIELIPDPELPTRIAKQLRIMATALAVMNNGEYGELDYGLLYKIAMDSIPKTRRTVLQTLYESADQIETATVATAIGYPTNTTRRILEDLTGLGLVQRQSQGAGNADLWRLTDETWALLSDVAPPPGVPEVSGQ